MDGVDQTYRVLLRYLKVMPWPLMRLAKFTWANKIHWLTGYTYVTVCDLDITLKLEFLSKIGHFEIAKRKGYS